MIDIAGPRDNFQIREMFFRQFCQLQVGQRIVNRIDQHFRFCRACRFQQIDARGIAVKDLHAEFTQRFDMVRIVIQNHHLHPTGEQQTTGDLTKTTKPGNDHPRLLFVDFIRFTFLLAARLFETSQQHQQNRRDGHRQRNGQRQRFRPFRIQHVCHLRRAKDHKREFTSLPQQHGKPAALSVRYVQWASNQPQHTHFNDQETDQQDEDPQRMRHQRAKVHRHADTDEEQPQQQTFERLDIAFQRMTIFGARQQNARQERPHRHG
ncbi:hypothetical protein D3C78_1036190 [compost metagenome]